MLARPWSFSSWLGREESRAGAGCPDFFAVCISCFSGKRLGLCGSMPAAVLLPGSQDIHVRS